MPKLTMRTVGDLFSNNFGLRVTKPTGAHSEAVNSSMRALDSDHNQIEAANGSKCRRDA